MVKAAKKNISDKFTKDMMKTDPKTWMMRMKKMSRAAHEKEQIQWRFQNENKSDQELTEDMADHFQRITNHFTPIDRSKLNIIPPNSSFVLDVPCTIEDYELL